ncbi:murein transglycosylase [Pseudonocardiaceae bacterium YIM PH 21723]|nr:murein transglycosylase [Pseudonocardiaceae bacterium YIM PH 21723]
MALLLFTGASAYGLKVLSKPKSGQLAQDIPALSVTPAKVKPGVAAPNASTGGQPQAGAVPPLPNPFGTAGEDPLSVWSNKVAKVTDIPARAARAYGYAELALRARQPSCKITWATLAGIGRIESNHGRWGGAILQDDGTPSRPIIGVPLDGAPGIQAIPDTDGGALDGDGQHDRAVGPMQFIPSTWKIWASDANGDGYGNPQNIDDAAVTAGRYLCAHERDLSTGQGWWDAVMSYNHSVEYGQKVYGLAETYTRSSLSAA